MRTLPQDGIMNEETYNDDETSAELASEQNQSTPDRLMEPVGLENLPRLPFPGVAIGASAGGLESTTNDLSSLLTSTDIAVISLDVHFRIRQFTPAIGDLFDLIPSDIGRPLRDLAAKFDDPALISDCAEVLGRLVPRETEVLSESGRHYIRRIHPYRTSDNRITGVVVTFIGLVAHI